jgi:nucleotide-binding universal stress UspA family protein
MFNRILAPLDGSALAECILPHLAALARISNTQVILLRVLDPMRIATRPRPVDPLDWQIRKAEAESYLQEIAARLQEAGIKADHYLIEGKAAESVIQFAESEQVDLILLSSHGQSGLSAWNVSSVVQQIILRAGRSVMIARAYQPITGDIQTLQYQRILLPLDASQRAEVVLPVAENIARSQGSELILAHVVRQPEVPRRTLPIQDDIELANQLTTRNREEAARYLEELESRLDVKIQTRLLVSDKVSASLHSLVEQDGVDLVMLSAHGYSAETRWPYGSVVVSFIAYGTTPLLVIQDMPANQIQPTQAEIAAREHGGR